MLKPKYPDSLPIPGQEPKTIHRDDDLWVVEKPVGWLTHPDGQSRRPSVTEWCALPVGVHQRLDIDTTGLLILSTSTKGAKTLQEALERRILKKRYLAVVDHWRLPKSGSIDSPMPDQAKKTALTMYRVLSRSAAGVILECQPVTGRRHQIRIHLASNGHPIRGDGRYGDPLDRRAPRTLLHCHSLQLPNGPEWVSPPPPDFAHAHQDAPSALRRDLITDSDTTCFREVHGAADGQPGWYVDRFDDFLWIQQDADAKPGSLGQSKGVYLTQGRKDRSHGGQAKPTLISGSPAPTTIQVMEHGVPYCVTLGRQLSTGLFLDQRPQRAWLAENAKGMRVLNTFGHAGAFSIAAAVGGAETVSIDLSKFWTGFIPEQMAHLGINTDRHDWIYGDVFQWLPKLAKRGDRFDLIILDPPSTSVGSKKKRWSARHDYPELVRLATELLAPNGRLWTSTNHRGLKPLQFARLVQKGAPGLQLERVCPPAVDFPCAGPPNQKTLVWRWPHERS
ncbi:MAG: hypothetical protein CMH52_01255 [Myxococcales bacterium]|nr:hypothetical protein [Myxococcales bacterium]